MKLDIACGANKSPGWFGIDIAPIAGVDIVHDLLTFPWPIADGVVTEARCEHFFEHVPARLRPAFMNEVYRILAPGAGVTFYTPLGFDRQCQDFTHEWPPIVPASFFYFSRAWLAKVNIPHYAELHGIRCDFDVADVVMSLHDGFEGERDARHVLNAAEDMAVLLVKK